MIDPMLAKLADESFFTKDNYIWEVKYDGARCIGQSNGTTRLWSRSQREMTENFPEIQIQTKLPAVLDGEIISVDENGKSIFNRVQHRTTRLRNVQLAAKEFPCIYQIFDIVECNGRDITKVPLLDRKQLLDKIFIPTPTTTLSPFTKDGGALYAVVEQKRWEGVIGKHERGIYRPGVRDWLKIKVGLTETFYIVGYTQGTGWRKSTFGALVLGRKNLPDDTEPFTYVGEVGTGFDTNMIEYIYSQLKSLPSSSCVFRREPEPATWVMPKLQCIVHFAEYTKDGKLRFPSFKGLV